MNTKLLLKVADAIKTGVIPGYNKKYQFNQSTWFETDQTNGIGMPSFDVKEAICAIRSNHCGTACCVAGTTVLIHCLENENYPQSHISIEQAAKALLNLPEFVSQIFFDEQFMVKPDCEDKLNDVMSDYLKKMVNDGIHPTMYKLIYDDRFEPRIRRVFQKCLCNQSDFALLYLIDIPG